jgi:predicted dehydrogenase
MTTRRNFKLGFIGAGFIAHFQGQALRMVRDVEVAGVYSVDGAPEFSQWVQAQGLGPCQVYPSIRQLCENVDAVMILSPNYARLECFSEIARAVAAGASLKGIVCEKPLGRTVAEAEQIVRIAEKMNIPTAYFENQLHMKAIKAQRNQLAPQQAAMGPLSLVRCSEEHGGPHSGWFWDPTRQGGGALADMGCHCIAVAWYLLTPIGKPLTFMEPVSINADMGLLKWGTRRYRQKLLDKFGVDYTKTPAEDFATGIITFRNPETGQQVKAQFTNSWMYDKQGLRLMMEGMGPGYAFEVNSLISPLEIFIGDEAAETVADAETALEKSTASRGLLSVVPNEADLYGYVDELEDAVKAFKAGRDGLANLGYGLEITKLCQAAYLSAEQKRTVDLTSPETHKTLKNYKSLIAQGLGSQLLLTSD